MADYREKDEEEQPRPDRVAETRAPYAARRPARRAGPAGGRPVQRPSGGEGDRGARIAARCDFAGRAFGSDAELARLLGVDRSRITRWRQGDLPDPANADRVVGIDAVVELLSGFLDERSISKWLYGVNAHLADRRPVDVLVSGRLSEVIAAIEAEKSGAFG
ncbi:MAG: hypothetical protein ABW277_07665 [Longimicrobiaceae bacterium]